MGSIKERSLSTTYSWTIDRRCFNISLRGAHVVNREPDVSIYLWVSGPDLAGHSAKLSTHFNLVPPTIDWSASRDKECDPCHVPPILFAVTYRSRQGKALIQYVPMVLLTYPSSRSDPATDPQS